VLLAVNEAIANAAEFAYVDSRQPGTLDVDATYDADSGTLAVTVNDHGRWPDKVPQPGRRTAAVSGPRHPADAGTRQRADHRPHAAQDTRRDDLERPEASPLHA